MNKYEIKVNNATIYSDGLSEFSALKNLCLFGMVEMVEAVEITDHDKEGRPDITYAWIYKVDTVNGIALAYIKEVRR